MIHEILKKKSYVRPKIEATWMENEDLLQQQSISATGPDAPWAAKLNNVSLLDEEDNPEDDGWGLYFGCDFEE